MLGSPMPPSSLAMAGGAVRPAEPDAWGPGVALALAAHALLVVALAWGVNWRSHEAEAIEAEVWSSVPVAEAPPPVVVVPQPRPPQAEPAPTPTETVPDLAIGKRKPKEPPPASPPPREREVFDSTPPKPRKSEPAPDPKLAREEARREKLAQEKAARAEQEARAQEQARAEAEQAAALEAQRQRILKDIVRNAGGGSASANPQANGQAVVSSGPSAAYQGRLRALFKRNLTWALEDPPGNPEVVVRITLAPDGTILSRKVVQPSASPAWDDAVLRAIDRTEVLPRDDNGRVLSPMLLTFKFRDY